MADQALSMRTTTTPADDVNGGEQQTGSGSRTMAPRLKKLTCRLKRDAVLANYRPMAIIEVHVRLFTDHDHSALICIDRQYDDQPVSLQTLAGMKLRHVRGCRLVFGQRGVTRHRRLLVSLEQLLHLSDCLPPLLDLILRNVNVSKLDAMIARLLTMHAATLKTVVIEGCIEFKTTDLLLLHALPGVHHLRTLGLNLWGATEKLLLARLSACMQQTRTDHFKLHSTIEEGWPHAVAEAVNWWNLLIANSHVNTYICHSGLWLYGTSQGGALLPPMVNIRQVVTPDWPLECTSPAFLNKFPQLEAVHVTTYLLGRWLYHDDYHPGYEQSRCYGCRVIRGQPDCRWHHHSYDLLGLLRAPRSFAVFAYIYLGRRLFVFHDHEGRPAIVSRAEGERRLKKLLHDGRLSSIDKELQPFAPESRVRVYRMNGHFLHFYWGAYYHDHPLRGVIPINNHVTEYW